MDLLPACQTHAKTMEFVWRMTKILTTDLRMIVIRTQLTIHGNVNVHPDFGGRSVKKVYAKIIHVNMELLVCCFLEVDTYVYARMESMVISANTVCIPHTFLLVL